MNTPWKSSARKPYTLRHIPTNFIEKTLILETNPQMTGIGGSFVNKLRCPSINRSVTSVTENPANDKRSGGN